MNRLSAPGPRSATSPQNSCPKTFTVLAGCVAHWFDTPEIDLRAAAGQTVELLLTGLQD
ncbi:hypothetical protein [Mycolicibacterium confluentis]|uniref:Uncharacterized protein n=1 Tax=Mycolicibacterium confluentis TaxID=28047 RepID=A0A7I7XSK0_9MYCO|nr:hypothetical protein [Mycolicibacterium confluentis]BBZ32205.1 hypothetical protein MCNF_08100 [Mycolicibacterium confluentis]